MEGSIYIFISAFLKLLPVDQQHPWTVAAKSCNTNKNRYKGIQACKSLLILKTKTNYTFHFMLLYRGTGQTSGSSNHNFIKCNYKPGALKI